MNPLPWSPGRILAPIALSSAILTIAVTHAHGWTEDASSPKYVSLLEGFEEAAVSGPPIPRAEITTYTRGLFRNDFSSGFHPRWFEGQWAYDTGNEREPLTSTALVEDPDGDRVVASLQPDVGGLHIVLRSMVPRYQIKVRLKATSPAASERPVLRATCASGYPPQGMNSREYLYVIEESLVGETKEASLAPGEDWQELVLLVDRVLGSHSVLVVLDPDVPVSLDYVEMVPLGVLAQQEESAESLAPARPERVRLESRTMDCLVLSSGGQVDFDVTVPTSSPRLGCSLASVGARAHSTKYRVLVDGEEAGARTVSIPRNRENSRFAPWEVSLEKHAGREVRISLRFEGEEPQDIGLFGAPKLLGAQKSLDRPNLLVLSLDTLRADALGCYGAERPTSPNIDGFAKQGVLFERNNAPASLTLPCHTSMFGGQNPIVHGANTISSRVSADRTPLISERLHSAGYQCAAFTAGGQLDPKYGLDRGFESYDIADPAKVVVRRGKRVNQVQPALDWLRSHADQQFYLLIHSYLVHGFIPEEEYIPLFQQDLPEHILAMTRTEIWKQGDAGDPLIMAHARNLYDSTVRQIDETLVAPVLNLVEELGLADNTIVSIISDHGEAFFEHQKFRHGKGIWKELVHVPWIMRGPGLPAGVRYEEPVRLEDFTPTIASLLELPSVPYQTGRNVLEQVEETPDTILHLNRPTVGRWDGIVAGRWKLLRHEHLGKITTHLYDLKEDPLESKDLSSEQPRVHEGLLRRLEHRLGELVKLRMQLPGEDAAEMELTPALRAQLQELGYIDDN